MHTTKVKFVFFHYLCFNLINAALVVACMGIEHLFTETIGWYSTFIETQKVLAVLVTMCAIMALPEALIVIIPFAAILGFAQSYLSFWTLETSSLVYIQVCTLVAATIVGLDAYQDQEEWDRRRREQAPRKPQRPK